MYYNKISKGFLNKLLILAFLFITSCTSQNKTENSGNEKVTDSPAVIKDDTVVTANISGCYGWIRNKDSAALNLTISGIKVSGSLSYHLYEKDNNKGTINGSLNDSLIVADYTFQSEGMTSVRQVVFKMKSDTLVEGYGDIVMKGDTASFKNISQLKFQYDKPFTKQDCK